MTRKQMKSAIIGMVLGDAHLGRGMVGNQYRKKSYIDMFHSVKQKEYLEWKQSIIQELFDYEIQTKLKTITNKKTGKHYPICGFRSRVHPRLTQIRKLMYVGTKKIVTKKALSYLDNLGMAIWFMDDGGLHKHPNGGWIVSLATNSFSEEANKLIQEWIEKQYGVRFNIYKHISGTYYLKRGISEGYKLIEAIREYVIPSMRYKVDYTMKKHLYRLSGKYNNDSTQHPKG